MQRYRSRLSGPLSDRIDMHMTLSAVPPRQLQHGSVGETSATIRQRVESCRAPQRRRYTRLSRVSCNADVPGRWLLAHGGLTPAARDVVATAMESLHLSARGFHRVLRISRTIADLDESEVVDARHAAEALRYRPRTSELPA